jgi:hypothetical protein
VHLIQVSLLLIGQQGLGHIFSYQPLLPIGWTIVQILRQRRRTTTNTAPTTLSGIQSTLINTQLLNTPLVVRRNDKNEQPTLLSQRKLALTAINTLFAI